MSNSKLRSILWEAWSSEVGIEIVTSDPEAFKRRFYKERADARTEGILEFDSLQLITPPADKVNKIWIVKHGQVQREKEGEANEEEPQTL